MRRLFRQPEIPVLFWQLVARFPMGMMTIGLLTWGENRYESYAAGGLLVAVFTLGYAAGSSLTTRLFRLLSSTVVLRVATVLTVSCMLVLAYVPGGLVAAVSLAAFSGVTFPPVTPLARSLYPRLSQGERLMRVYSFDAIAQEAIWILAPLFAIGVAGGWGPQHVIGLCALFVLAGTTQFSRLRVLREHGPRRKEHAAVGEALPPSFPPMIIGFFAIGFFLVASGAFLEVYIVEQFGYGGLLSGVLLALVAAGSIIGGLAFARRPVKRYSLALRLAIVATGLLTAAVGSSFWLIVAGMLASGAGIAPSFTAIHMRIAVSAPPSRAAEVYAVANTMQLVGLSAGSALAGLMVETLPAQATLLAGFGCVVLATGIALSVGRAHNR